MFNWKQDSKLLTFHRFNQIVRVTYSQLRTHSCHLHSVYLKRLSLGFQRISLTLRRWACHERLGLTENQSTKKSISNLLIITSIKFPAVSYDPCFTPKSIIDYKSNCYSNASVVLCSISVITKNHIQRQTNQQQLERTLCHPPEGGHVGTSSGHESRWYPMSTSWWRSNLNSRWGHTLRKHRKSIFWMRFKS